MFATRLQENTRDSLPRWNQGALTDLSSGYISCIFKTVFLSLLIRFIMTVDGKFILHKRTLGAVQILRNAIFVKIRHPPTPLVTLYNASPYRPPPPPQHTFMYMHVYAYYENHENLLGETCINVCC